MYLCFFYFVLLYIKKEREKEQGKKRGKELVSFFKIGTVKDFVPF